MNWESVGPVEPEYEALKAAKDGVAATTYGGGATNGGYAGGSLV